jgi:hypothetical protein
LKRHADALEFYRSAKALMSEQMLKNTDVEAKILACEKALATGKN